MSNNLPAKPEWKTDSEWSAMVADAIALRARVADRINAAAGPDYVVQSAAARARQTMTDGETIDALECAADRWLSVLQTAVWDVTPSEARPAVSREDADRHASRLPLGHGRAPLVPAADMPGAPESERRLAGSVAYLASLDGRDAMDLAVMLFGREFGSGASLPCQTMAAGLMRGKIFDARDLTPADVVVVGLAAAASARGESAPEWVADLTAELKEFESDVILGLSPAIPAGIRTAIAYGISAVATTASHDMRNAARGSAGYRSIDDMTEDVEKGMRNQSAFHAQPIDGADLALAALWLHVRDMRATERAVTVPGDPALTARRMATARVLNPAPDPVELAGIVAAMGARRAGRPSRQASADAERATSALAPVAARAYGLRPATRATGGGLAYAPTVRPEAHACSPVVEWHVDSPGLRDDAALDASGDRSGWTPLTGEMMRPVAKAATIGGRAVKR